MDRSSDNSAGLIIGVFTFLFLAAVWKLSTMIGAEFGVTLSAASKSIGGILLIGAVIWFLKLNVWASVFFLLAVIWPCWWPVLDHLAEGGTGSTMRYFIQQPWWATVWTKWLGEILVFVLASYCWIMQDR